MAATLVRHRHGCPLVHILDLRALGLLDTNKEWLEGGGKALTVEGALLTRLHVRGTVPQTHGTPCRVILRVLHEPTSTQPLDVTSAGRHRGMLPCSDRSRLSVRLCLGAKELVKKIA